MHTTAFTASVEALEAQLLERATPERAEFERGYLKSELRFLGAKVPETRKAARRLVRDLAPLDRSQSLDLSSELWERGVYELRMAAIEVLRETVDLLDGHDLTRIEVYLREARTWALVDNLAIHVAGPLVRESAIADHYLERWIQDPDFWIRRAALLALLLDLRAGTGDRERLSRYADSLLKEREFFIRKAIGWVLRETSKQHPDWVSAWLRERIGRVSGLTLREGSKRLPAATQLSLRNDPRRGG